MSFSCKTLAQFFDTWGEILGGKAQALLKPLHVPARDRPEVPPLLRTPFPAQAHAITAAVKCLARQRAVQLVCEMGTGKTLMGAAAAHADARGRPYRALVTCPGHLVDKWVREIKETIPDARVRAIRSWEQVMPLMRLAVAR